MIYDALAKILSTNVYQLVAGKNLFVNQAPVNGVTCALFRDNPGGFEIDGYVPTERRGDFTFVVRGKDQPEIVELMTLAIAALTINQVLQDSYLIKICRPLTEPISYQLSVGNLREISVNFSINYGIVQ